MTAAAKQNCLVTVEHVWEPADMKHKSWTVKGNMISLPLSKRDRAGMFVQNAELALLPSPEGMNLPANREGRDLSF